MLIRFSEWLVEVFSQAVSMNVADWLGVDD